MRPTRLLCPLAPVLVIAGLATGHAQTSSPQAQPPPRAQESQPTEVHAIAIDVVVRDQAGHPVTDLDAQDFELFEDGVRQRVGSFTPIVGAESTRRPAAPVTGTTATPTAAPELMAFVFDRLTPDARALATEAALQYVGSGATTSNTIAVFGIDLSLVMYQPFTRDADLVRHALEVVRMRSSSQFGTTQQAQLAAAEEAQQGADQVADATASAGGPGQGAPDVGGAAAAAQFAQMQSRMLQRFESLERDQQGYSTSNALMAIVSAMKAIAGRKSVIFFSEGLSIPPNVQAQFVSVIDAANRANVSIYSMDAAGLRTESTLTQTRQGVQAASAATLGRDPARDMTDRPMMEALERNEDLLRADPQSGLGTLADQTGGFLIANSNDLRRGFSRVDTDMRNYYLLTYVPENAQFDGTFRTIDVKVRRPGVRVSSRKGYFAVRPSLTGAPVLSYEAPALALLERTPLPNAFPARSTALLFPEPSRIGLVPVIVNVPMSGMTFQAAADGKIYTSDILVLVQFKNGAGQVVEKVSQRYQIQGPVEQQPRAGLGEILFYREPVLAPGVYTMETLVYDALAAKASVRILTIDVPDANPRALRLSSLVAVRRSEKVPEHQRMPGSPLYVGDQLLYPSFGEPFSKASARELPFYFIAYPTSGGGETRATLELFEGGKQLAQAPLPLAAAGENGQIANVSRIPLDALSPGRYELRVRVDQGTQTASRVLAFQLEP